MLLWVAASFSRWTSFSWSDRPLIDHLPTTYRPLTDHLPTTYWPLTNHLPTTYRPLTDHLPATYWPLTNHLTTTYWPLIDHLSTTYWPPTGHLPITYQPPTNSFLQCSLFNISWTFTTDVHLFVSVQALAGETKHEQALDSFLKDVKTALCTGRICL